MNVFNDDCNHCILDAKVQTSTLHPCSPPFHHHHPQCVFCDWMRLHLLCIWFTLDVEGLVILLQLVVWFPYSHVPLRPQSFSTLHWCARLDKERCEFRKSAEVVPKLCLTCTFYGWWLVDGERTRKKKKEQIWNVSIFGGQRNMLLMYSSWVLVWVCAGVLFLYFHLLRHSHKS